MSLDTKFPPDDEFQDEEYTPSGGFEFPANLTVEFARHCLAGIFSCLQTWISDSDQDDPEVKEEIAGAVTRFDLFMGTVKRRYSGNINSPLGQCVLDLESLMSQKKYKEAISLFNQKLRIERDEFGRKP